MKARLVLRSSGGIEKSYQEFYELSEPITKTAFKDYLSIKEILTKVKTRLKNEYKYLIEDGQESVNIVCISDAHTHNERLVFLGVLIKNGNYNRLSDDHIDGVYTMMIHGGDQRKMYRPEVYLKRLAKANGLIWEGLEK